MAMKFTSPDKVVAHEATPSTSSSMNPEKGTMKKAQEKVLAIKTQLETITSSSGGTDSNDEILSLLKKLCQVPMNRDILSSTRIGMIVNQLRRNTKNEEVSTLARSLIKKWRIFLNPAAGDALVTIKVNEETKKPKKKISRKLDDELDEASTSGDVKKAKKEAAEPKSPPKFVNSAKTMEDLQNGNEHPLLNSLVLETIFQYTGSLEEVKRNRLVSRTWMNASESQWTTLTKTLTLFRNEELPQEAELPSDEAVMTLQQLMERSKGARSALEKVVLYRKFKFQNWTFDGNLLHTLNTVNEPITMDMDRWFWYRIAPNLIKSLTLEGCHFPVRFMPFEECVLKALPNLETLSVINCTTSPGFSDAVRRVTEVLEQRENTDYKHQNLKCVQLNVPRQGCEFIQSTSLIPFMGLVSSLEEVRIEGVHDFLEEYIMQIMVRRMVRYSVNRGLKKLHLLDFSIKTYNGTQTLNLFHDMGGVDNSRFDNLQEFHYEVGYGEEAQREIVFIQVNMPVLEKLYLYRAPLLSLSLANFLKGHRIESLTELHLWGNWSSSLEFLNAFPNLQVFKWVTSCYEEKFHGDRVTSVLEESEELRTWPLLRKDIVSQSEDISALEHLTMFELDCGPMCGASWKQLGVWMPNLKNLKGLVSRVEHFGIIREQWKQLETLELAHGSRITGKKMLRELAKFGGNLKTFKWKGCACTRELFGKGIVSGLEEDEKKLGSQLPEKCTFPWNAILEGDEATVCKHAEFEGTLMSRQSRLLN